MVVLKHAARPTLELDFVLDDEVLALGVDLLWELGGDGVVGSFVFDHQALVLLHTLEHSGLLDSPGTHVSPFLFGGLVVLLCMRGLPPGFPVVGELLEEGRLQLGRLFHGQESAKRALAGAMPGTYSEGRLHNGSGRRLLSSRGARRLLCMHNGSSEKRCSTGDETHGGRSSLQSAEGVGGNGKRFEKEDGQEFNWTSQENLSKSDGTARRFKKTDCK